MTRWGVARHAVGPIVVSSTGSTPTAGWTKVLEIPNADLPDRASSASKYLLVAMGNGGNPQGSQMPVTSGCEIALGYVHASTGAITIAHYLSRCRESSQSGIYGTNRGFPWWYSTAQAFTFNPTVHSPAIFARIHAPTTTVGQFDVGGLSLHAIALDSFDPSDFVRYFSFLSTPYVATTGSTFLVQPIGLTTLSGSEQWLVFVSFVVEPDWDPRVLTPTFVSLVLTDGNPAHDVEILAPSGHGAHAGSSGQTRVVFGGWVVASGLVGSVSLRITGARSTGGFYPTAVQLDVTAIRISAIPSITSHQRELGDPGQPAILTDYGDTPVPEPIAFSNPYFADLELLVQALIPKSVGKVYEFVAVTPSGTLYSGSPNDAPFVGPTSQDGDIAAHFGGPIPLAPADGAVRVHMRTHPQHGAAGGPHFCDNFRTLVIDYDLDADTSRDTVPALPPATFIDPGTESLGTGSLSDLPIAPDRAYETQVEDPRHRFEADDGTVVTWPSMIGFRRTFRLMWSTLTNAQADTLRAFLLGNRSWRWQPERDPSKVAMTHTADLEVEDLGNGTCAARLQAVELIYTG